MKGANLAAFRPGQGIAATGRWVRDPCYGEQFLAASADETIPTDSDGMARWLEQVGIPGIGQMTARKIAAAFGADAIQRIAESHPDAVAMLGRRFEDARRAMTERHAEAAFGPLLAGYDIGKATRKKIFDLYGMDTARIIQADPYRLIRDVDGIAFSTADRIAHATGTASLDRSRLKAAAIDALREATGQGHTAVVDSDLARMITARTGVSGPLVDLVVADIDDPAAVPTAVEDAEGKPVNGWALAAIDAAEQRFAEAVMTKVRQRGPMTFVQAERFVAMAVDRLNAFKRKDDKVALNAQQHAAAVMALMSGFSILTGGPSTGKTFVLNVITKAWRLAARERIVARWSASPHPPARRRSA